MLLLTDGEDTGGDHGLKDAIDACQRADTMVYSIRYVDPAQAKLPLSIRGRNRKYMERFLTKGKRDLEQLSGETGGHVFEGESANLPEIFNSIETALRSEYVLAYTQSKIGQQGYHKIKVRVKRPGLVVRTRDGYYAH